LLRGAVLSATVSDLFPRLPRTPLRASISDPLWEEDKENQDPNPVAPPARYVSSASPMPPASPPPLRRRRQYFLGGVDLLHLYGREHLVCSEWWSGWYGRAAPRGADVGGGDVPVRQPHDDVEHHVHGLWEEKRRGGEEAAAEDRKCKGAQFPNPTRSHPHRPLLQNRPYLVPCGLRWRGTNIEQHVPPARQHDHPRRV
jgi:hypothetical protein